MLKKSMYLMASKLIGYGVRLILPFFLVRLLSKADFGAYRQFFLLEVYIGTILQVGLNQALYYFIPRDMRNAGGYFLNSLLLNVVVFSAAFAAVGISAEPLARWLNMDILERAFWVLALHTTLLMLSGSCDCYLTARGNIRASAVFEIGGQMLASVGTVWAAWTYRTLQPVLVALVVTRTVHLLAMLAYIHFGLRGFRAERYFLGWRQQLRYGIVLGLSGTFGTMLARLHDFIVSRYYGTEVYAVYSVGCTEIPVIQLLSQSLAVVALGQFAALEKAGDWSGVRRLWDRVLVSMCAVGVPALVLLMIAAKPIVVLMFTPEYVAAVPIFVANTVLKVSLLFNATLVLRAMDRNDVTIWVNGLTLAVSPFVLYAAMRAGGLHGIIWVQAALMIASRVVPVYWMNRIVPQRLPYLPQLRGVLEFYVVSWRAIRRRAAGLIGAGGR